MAMFVRNKSVSIPFADDTSILPSQSNVSLK